MNATIDISISRTFPHTLCIYVSYIQEIYLSSITPCDHLIAIRKRLSVHKDSRGPESLPIQPRSGYQPEREIYQTHVQRTHVSLPPPELVDFAVKGVQVRGHLICVEVASADEEKGVTILHACHVLFKSIIVVKYSFRQEETALWTGAENKNEDGRHA